MAKFTKDELLNAIAEMTVLELSEFVKAVEEKFGTNYKTYKDTSWAVKV